MTLEVCSNGPCGVRLGLTSLGQRKITPTIHNEGYCVQSTRRLGEVTNYVRKYLDQDRVGQSWKCEKATDSISVGLSWRGFPAPDLGLGVADEGWAKMIPEWRTAEERFEKTSPIEELIR